jgi:endonuclease/exonuclease/phosphatase (EEP) superfamily protein YafD
VQRAVRDNSIRAEEIASQQRFASGRRIEDLNIRDFVDSHRGSILILVGGDFNTPASSAHFRQTWGDLGRLGETWGDLTNSFSEAGWGYQFTARCDGPGPYAQRMALDPHRPYSV